MLLPESETLMGTNSLQFRMKGYIMKSILSKNKTAKRDKIHLMGMENETHYKCMKRNVEKK